MSKQKPDRTRLRHIPIRLAAAATRLLVTDPVQRDIRGFAEIIAEHRLEVHISIPMELITELFFTPKKNEESGK